MKMIDVKPKYPREMRRMASEIHRELGDEFGILAVDYSGERDLRVELVPYLNELGINYVIATLSQDSGLIQGYRKILSDPKEIVKELSPIRPPRKILVYDNSVESGASFVGSGIFVLENHDKLGVEKFYMGVTRDYAGCAPFSAKQYYDEYVGPFNFLMEYAPQYYRELVEQHQSLIGDVLYRDLKYTEIYGEQRGIVDMSHLLECLARSLYFRPSKEAI